ncbi:YkgJ family cysteine cluster protein [Candidatus Micrarchaeota archaeon]|nr:YkgJ family cysteine cluster protein [Candidatus Micrarchaeota archaeon]MBU1166110.1 YkgJ family cysteine cluster protein [Candidatus Micrarchaeota archaeon]MBU1887033.1 YkgJ family cysteine cluster protein [Candidatus Micrarchaeota archaeon]
MPINPCTLCNANCCKTYTITVTPQDIIRISNATGKKPEEFAVLHEAKLLSYDPDLVLTTLDGYGYYLLGIKSHPCIFLEKSNKCSVHSSAPLSCKRYPFAISGVLNTRFCPSLSKFLFRLKCPDIDDVQLKKEISDYKEIVRTWNYKPGKKEEVLGFVLSIH